MSSRREQYLARIGLPIYELKGGAATLERDVGQESLELSKAPEPSNATARPSKNGSADPPPISAMPAPKSAGAEPPPKSAGAEPPPVSASDAWTDLAARVAGCTRCALHRGRRQTVFGVGRGDAELMVVGEAPGAEEDRQGEPFVGRAGQLLNAMLRAIGFPREQVYIANILKCRPPNNRDPSPEEIGLCTEYLREQIALVAPRALLGVGRIAAQWLLQTDSPIGRLRGRTHRFDAGIPLIVTYHPAYLLRTPAAKAKAWQDLCMVRRLVAARGADAGAAFEKTAR